MGFAATIGYSGDSIGQTLTGGNDVVLFNFRPVPEPELVLAVAVVGLAGVGLLRRLRRPAGRTVM